MRPNGSSSTSTEAARIVDSVKQLSAADQDRILRIVSLLARVPPAVQHRTHGMLGRLLAANPDSLADCVAAVDEIIEYLENEAIVRGTPPLSAATFEPVTESSGSGWN